MPKPLARLAGRWHVAGGDAAYGDEQAVGGEHGALGLFQLRLIVYIGWEPT